MHISFHQHNLPCDGGNLICYVRPDQRWRASPAKLSVANCVTFIDPAEHIINLC